MGGFGYAVLTDEGITAQGADAVGAGRQDCALHDECIARYDFLAKTGIVYAQEVCAVTLGFIQ